MLHGQTAKTQKYIKSEGPQGAEILTTKITILIVITQRQELDIKYKL